MRKWPNRTRLVLTISLVPAVVLKAGMCILLFSTFPIVAAESRVTAASESQLPPCHRTTDQKQKAPASSECCKVIEAVQMAASQELFVVQALVIQPGAPKIPVLSHHVIEINRSQFRPPTSPLFIQFQSFLI